MSATVPLRIDSELVHQARSEGALHDRPPTAQIEHWAKLGRVLESVLSGKSTARVKAMSRVVELDAIVEMTQTTKGQAKARAVVARHRGPIYTADPDRPNVILEKLPDGSVRRGRFINRKFVPTPNAGASTSKSAARRG